MLDPALLIFVASVVLFAGFVKGTVGLGFPTTFLGLATTVLAPRLAISLILLPMLVVNLWQLYRSGEVWQAVKRYRWFLICMVVLGWVTVQSAVLANDRVLFGVLGAAIIGFVLLSWTIWRPKISEAQATGAQVGFGALSGIMGGLVAVWAPPVILYLSGRQVPKDEFVRASGLILFVGTIPLVIGYLRQGLLTPNITITSLLLCIPVVAGFAVGEALRHRLSEDGFRRFMLMVFFLMGLNLLRRAFLG